MNPLLVSINGANIIISQTESASFLGFEINSGLRWVNHINKVCAKIESACVAFGSYM